MSCLILDAVALQFKVATYSIHATYQVSAKLVYKAPIALMAAI